MIFRQAALSLVVVSLLMASARFAAADDEQKPAKEAAAQKQAAQKQLEKVQQLVGQWRGVGQPQRGSTRDSWVEEADWQWSFADGVSLVGKLPKGKYFSEVKIVCGAKDGEYELVAKPAAGGEDVRYTGAIDESERLVLVAAQPREGLPAEPREGLPARVSFRFVADGDRMLVLLERKGTGDLFVRLAEVGYTRQGSGFGQGSRGPECVVTGGAGTIEVVHKGQKYYVCCTGCLEYFKDNPDEVLAEYAARKEAERKEKEQAKKKAGR